MKDERRRSRVEQLGIVDAEHHLTIPGARAQLLPAASQQRDDVIGANLVRNQIGDGRERYGRRAARALDPTDERPVALGRRLRLADQARLADAGAGDDHHPVTSRARHGPTRSPQARAHGQSSGHAPVSATTPGSSPGIRRPTELYALRRSESP